MEKQLSRAFLQGWLGYRGQRTVYLTDEELLAAEEIEKEYLEKEWPKIKSEIEEFKKTVPQNEQREMRRHHILSRIQELKPKYLETQSPDLRRELQSLLFESKVFVGSFEGITPEQISRARAFPIERLIKHQNYMAICPFHKDRSPSLNIRKNFFFCHGCGETGDVIDFVMKRDGASFREAVKKLYV